MRKILFFIVLLFTGLAARAQDQQYTQFYAAPLYLNPAFAGTSIQSRASMIYRNQWPSLPKSFVSYNVAYDQYFSDINSGIGLLVSHDRAGTGGLSYTNIALQYAYEIKINRKFSVRPAINFGYGSTYLDIDRLTFNDQLARGPEAGGTIDPDRSRFALEPVGSADFGAGMLLFSDKFWFGAALDHINEPIQSLTNRDSRLPKRMSIHSGFRIKVNDLGAHSRRQYVVPAIHYQAQGLFDQVDVGVYYEYDPLVLGLWYRGIPGFKTNDYGPLNQDAIAILVGYEVNNYRFGYSYDLTISSLTAQSAGAHEISIMVEWASRRGKKASKRRVIPCAKF